MTTAPPVTYDFAAFIALFPEFTPLGSGLCSAYFNIATATIIANTTTNPAFFDGNLSTLIYLATAHVAWLLCPKDSNGVPSSSSSASMASQQVGRISNASQGTVSVQLDWPGTDPSAQEKYLSQTKYGATLWAALAPYRTAQYAAQPTFVFGGRFRGNRWPVVGPWGAGLW